MSRFFFLLRRPLRDIGRRPLAAIGSFLSLLLLFLLFDIVWISSLSSQKYYNRLISGIDIEIFVNDNLPDSVLETMRQSISAFEGVEKVNLISKDDAYLMLNDLMGADLLNGLDSNPLPRSLILTFRDNFLSAAILENYRSRLLEYDGVSNIFYARDWLERAEYAKSMISKFVLFLGIVIFLAVLLNSIHAVRLSAAANQHEIVQLRLLGAGGGFLSFPFVFEGLLYSLIASLAGWGLLFYGADYFAFKNIEIVFPASLEIFYFCLLASLMGLFGGYLGSRRFLSVNSRIF